MPLTHPNTQSSILQELHSNFLQEHGVQLYVKRDDLIHPIISGNKWRKLKYNILNLKEQKKEGILTFGGAFSNHLVATAAACQLNEVPAIGIVRGDELNASSNDTLKLCAELGMQLIFVSREEYALRNMREYHEELIVEHPNYMVVPEGGANYMGMIGCQEIAKELDQAVDLVVVAQGTSTTSCGVLIGLNEHQKLAVVPALKGYDSRSEMKQLLGRTGIDSEYIEEMLKNKTLVWDDYHFGGYAKVDDELVAFIQDFYRDYHLKLDPVYTAKAMYALFDKIKKGEVENQKVAFIHTGGLQGAKSYEDKLGVEFYTTTSNG